jgi:acetyl-CoA acetyltransferase
MDTVLSVVSLFRRPPFPLLTLCPSTATAAQVFGNAGEEYCKRYGSNWDDIADIAVKNSKHSENNPYAQFRQSKTREEVLGDKKVTNYVRRCASLVQCSKKLTFLPPDDAVRFPVLISTRSCSYSLSSQLHVLSDLRRGRLRHRLLRGLPPFSRPHQPSHRNRRSGYDDR